jgi:predicted MFS family arabinose efflux permease
MGVAIFGAMLGPVIGGIASVTSTEVTFGGVACIGLALAAWAAMTPSHHEPSGQPVSMLFAALTKPRMLAGVWLVALPSISFGMLGVLAPLRLHALGLSAVAISAVWIVVIAVEATTTPAVGYVSDRRGRIWPLRLAAGFAVASFALFPASDGHWWSYAAVIVVCSFALGSFWAPSMSLASDEAEALGLDYAFGFAIINLAWAPSQVAGSAGGGRLADVTSDAVVYLVLAGLFALTLAALWRSASSSWRIAARSQRASSAPAVSSESPPLQ